MTLPDKVEFIPVAKPTNPFTDSMAPAGVPAPGASASAPTQSPAQAAQAAAIPTQMLRLPPRLSRPNPPPDTKSATGRQVATAETDGVAVPAPADKSDVYVTATDPAQPLAVAPTPKSVASLPRCSRPPTLAQPPPSSR